MSAQTLLSGGDKWYSYSGVLFGDVSVPATIQMIFVPNTGLRDSYVRIMPFYAIPISNATTEQLGVIVKIDDVEIIKIQLYGTADVERGLQDINLFVPRQSKLEVLSLNTTGNNTQERGATLIGYYL